MTELMSRLIAGFLATRTQGGSDTNVVEKIQFFYLSNLIFSGYPVYVEGGKGGISG